MPVKATGSSTTPEFDAFDGGFTWIAHPEEGMQRASHALVTDGGVWLVDPVDAEEMDARIAEHGEVAGVVVLLDRHERDSARIARRHDVPVTRPPGVDREFDVPTRDVSGNLPGPDYEFLSVQDWPGWREVGLWDGETLVVPESLGTNSFSLAGGERLGLNPVARLAPPRHLSEYDPERILVGHGHPVLDDAPAALRDALANARRRLPRAWFGAARAIVR
jgi:hypothetical protein